MAFRIRIWSLGQGAGRKVLPTGEQEQEVMGRVRKTQEGLKLKRWFKETGERYLETRIIQRGIGRFVLQKRSQAKTLLLLHRNLLQQRKKAKKEKREKGRV